MFTRRHGRRQKDAGFSLVELLVAMTLLGVISILAASLFSSSFRQTRRLTDEFDMRSAGLSLLREIEFGITDEPGAQSGLMGAANVEVVVVQGKTTLEFTDHVGNKTTYAHVDDAILRSVGAGETSEAQQTILQNVDAFRVCTTPFGDGSTKGETIVIGLELRGGGTARGKVDLTTEIYVRNADANNFGVPVCAE